MATTLLGLALLEGAIFCLGLFLGMSITWAVAKGEVYAALEQRDRVVEQLDLVMHRTRRRP